MAHSTRCSSVEGACRDLGDARSPAPSGGCRASSGSPYLLPPLSTSRSPYLLCPLSCSPYLPSAPSPGHPGPSPAGGRLRCARQIAAALRAGGDTAVPRWGAEGWPRRVPSGVTSSGVPKSLRLAGGCWDGSQAGSGMRREAGTWRSGGRGKKSAWVSWGTEPVPVTLVSWAGGTEDPSRGAGDAPGGMQLPALGAVGGEGAALPGGKKKKSPLCAKPSFRAKSSLL